jgi:hypothetical protein
LRIIESQQLNTEDNPSCMTTKELQELKSEILQRGKSALLDVIEAATPHGEWAGPAKFENVNMICTEIRKLHRSGKLQIRRYGKVMKQIEVIGIVSVMENVSHRRPRS